MKGGFNKILRNIVAGASDTEFEKVSQAEIALLLTNILMAIIEITKATFHLDSKEPKEKHVICRYCCNCTINSHSWSNFDLEEIFFKKFIQLICYNCFV